MIFTHSPERNQTPADRPADPFGTDPFDVVLHHLIAIESAAAERRQAARRAEAQLSLF
jgi:hypothetical protein